MDGSSPHRRVRLTSRKSLHRTIAGLRSSKSAGFEGVELHSANGYLPDQFLQDGTNKRTDAYGGSIENRSRFVLGVVQALVSVWGGDRVAVRIGPSGTFNGMSDTNPGALFDYLAGQLDRLAWRISTSWNRE